MGLAPRGALPVAQPLLLLLPLCCLAGKKRGGKKRVSPTRTLLPELEAQQLFDALLASGYPVGLLLLHLYNRTLHCTRVCTR